MLNTRRCLLAGVALVVLLQLLATPAEAVSIRKLLQDPWAGAGGGNWSPWGSYWNPYGNGRYYNPDPVGSGCYHPETYTRYKSGQEAWCSNGNRLYCYMGHWSGTCSSYWANKKL